MRSIVRSTQVAVDRAQAVSHCRGNLLDGPALGLQCDGACWLSLRRPLYPPLIYATFLSSLNANRLTFLAPLQLHLCEAKQQRRDHATLMPVMSTCCMIETKRTPLSAQAATTFIPSTIFRLTRSRCQTTTAVWVPSSIRFSIF